MKSNGHNSRERLQSIAHRVMLERGLEPDFPPAAIAQVEQLRGPAKAEGAGIRDLRELLWCSIDNDDSRDLDQLTVAEALDGGKVRLYVAIADVDALVPAGSPVDGHAKANTTSVYTAARIFPMLPERLSTDLTSLNEGEERLAVVVAIDLDDEGQICDSEIYRARVFNRAKLAYNSVAAWLEGTGPLPPAAAAVKGLAENLKLQDEATRDLRKLRAASGALTLESIEAKPVFENDHIQDLEAQEKNRAKELIEDCMIAANGVTARFLDAKGYASLRRVVRVPKRWPRIVDLAREFHVRLPDEPDHVALAKFLDERRAADPEGFPELSLSVVKLLGSGEYAVDLPGQDPPGHFGLAVRDYAHSTAPNRRFPDLITQRLLKAAFTGSPAPYSVPELEALASQCTKKEDDAQKVERQVRKSAAALLLSDRIGQTFDGIVTGASEKGTWVRVFRPPVEGRLERGAAGLDVGDRLRVRLLDTDVERGFIDFARIDG
ncbi:MAG TPA: RNB domain-containing ribonuclease [Thermoanaerobaculia bacterium]|nr:RNB domain-containing ribonuclease [Thermoanaerobaculia bacterium]